MASPDLPRLLLIEDDPDTAALIEEALVDHFGPGCVGRHCSTVAEVLEVPISTLVDSRNIGEEVRVQTDGQLVHARSYAYGHHLIYGATARILRQFLEMLERSGWPGES